MGLYIFERSWTSWLRALWLFRLELKNKCYFSIGEFWNAQTKQLFFQLLQVLNNSKKILHSDLSQEIIFSWACWTAVFVAFFLAAVNLNFSICYLHSGSSKFLANDIKNWNIKIADVWVLCWASWTLGATNEMMFGSDLLWRCFSFLKNAKCFSPFSPLQCKWLPNNTTWNFIAFSVIIISTEKYLTELCK